jgi:succinyl-diaminopimelate desuccinylase
VPTLEFEPCNAAAFLTTPDSFTNLVADAVERKTGRRPTLSTSGGTLDARFIGAYCPVLEFGGIGATTHTVDEHIAVAELDALTEIFRIRSHPPPLAASWRLEHHRCCG